MSSTGDGDTYTTITTTTIPTTVAITSTITTLLLLLHTFITVHIHTCISPTGAGASYTTGPVNRVGSNLMQIQSPTTLL